MTTSREFGLTELREEEIFKEGHHSTDVVCCAGFSVSSILFLSILAFAVKTGDVDKLTRGIDSSGRVCGISPDVRSKPVLYFCPESTFSSNLSDLKLALDESVCLEKCPLGSKDKTANSTLKERADSSAVPACKVSQAYGSELALEFSGFCVPSGQGAKQAALNLLEEKGSKFVLDAMDALAGYSRSSKSWSIVLAVAFASIIMGYLFLFILREVAGIMIWLSLGTLVVVMVGAGVLMFKDSDVMGDQLETELDEMGSVDAGKHKEFLAYGVAVGLWILAALTVFMVCSCKDSVQMSVACIQAGCDVMWNLPTMLLAPLIKSTVKVLVIVVCIVGFLQLFTVGELAEGSTTFHRKWDFSSHQYLFMLFYIFYSFWLGGFISALYEFSVAYSVAKYYHTEPEQHDEEDRNTGSCVIAEGVSIGLLKHTGSLALGSIIMAFTQFTRHVAEWAYNKQQSDSLNPVMSIILTACCCCCMCCQESLKFMNHQIYIDIAITSKNFCEAISSVMHIMADFWAAITVLNGATVMFQFMGVVLVTVFSGILADFLFYTYTNEEPAGGIAVCCIIAFYVAWSFMSVFDVTTDTLLYCYALDRNRHGRAEMCPKEMRELFEIIDHETIMDHADRHDKYHSSHDLGEFSH